MTFKLADSIKETSTTPASGTGDSIVSGVAPTGGNKPFASYLAIGDTTWLTRRGGDDFETGLFTYSALNTLTPTAIFESTNGNTPVVWGAGVKTLMCDLPASRVGTMASKNLSDAFALTNAADATSATSGGAFTVAGGLAVGKKLFVGSDVNVAGLLTAGAGPFTGGVAGDLAVARNSTTGAIYMDTSGLRYIYNSGSAFSFIGRPLSVADTTASTSTTTGSLQVAGGAGVGGQVNAGGGFRGANAASSPILSNGGSSAISVPTSGAAVVYSGSYAFLMVTDVGITGQSAMFMLSAGVATLVSAAMGTWVAGLAPATNQMSVGYSGGNFVIINNHPGGTIQVRTMLFAMN